MPSPTFARIALPGLLLFSFLGRAAAHFEYQQHVLANGMRIVTLEDHSCPIVTVDLWYHVGSKDEDPQRQGFAHMFEHMMFRGTDRLGPTDHFDLVRQTGGNCNAYTSFDQTVYTQTVPANQLELVMWLEAERMTMLKIDQESFDTERKVVEEERRMGLNRPYGRLLEKVLPELFEDHPYRWSTIGSIPHLRATSVDELRQFWNRYYVPNNATMIVVGDVKHADVVAMAEKYFGWIPRGEDPPRIEPPSAPPMPARQLTFREKNAPAPGVGLLFKGVPLQHDDYIPLQMMAMILGGGESSRLYQRIVADDESAVVAGALAFSLEQDGIIAAGAVLPPLGGDSDRVLATIHEEIQRIRDTEVSDRELTKARNQMLRSLTLENLSIGTKARTLGSAAVLENDPARVNRRFDQIQQTTAADILRVAQKYLNEDHALTAHLPRNLLGSLGSMLGFGDSEEDAPITGGTEVNPPPVGRPGVTRPTEFPATAPVAQLLPFDATLRFQEETLDNGLRIVVIENHELPMVSVTLGITDGAWTETKPGTCSLATAMLTKGTTTRSAQELAEELEYHAISLDGNAELDTCSVSASCLTDQLARAVELLADTVRNPSFPKEELRKVMQQARTTLAVSSKEPSYLADRELNRQLYGDHPYSRSVTGELADLDQINEDVLSAWWRHHVTPDRATLIFAGDCDLPRARQLANQFFGDWKSPGPHEATTMPEIPAPATTRIVLVDHPGEQTEIRVGQLGITRSHPDYFASQVLSAYFGGSFSSRLNDAIRVKKGLTYGARGGFSANQFSGLFRASTFSKHESAVETLRTILEEIDRVRDEAPSEKELSMTKSYFVGSFPATRETPQQVAGELWRQTHLGLPVDYASQLLRSVSEATPEDCLNVAKNHINPDQLTIVVVGPAKQLEAELSKIAPVDVVNPVE